MSGFGNRTVLVRGFDYGTTDEQIIGHMATVGTVEHIQKVAGGSACVTFSSPEEAKWAVAQLNQTNIAGNRRYLDLLLMDPQEFVAGIDPDKAARFLSMNIDEQQAVMAKGTLSTARDPAAVLTKRMNEAKDLVNASAVLSFGSAGSSTGGGCSVLVRGFDFGTSDEQINGHMSSVGTVVAFQKIDDGAACVTYSSAEEAQWAVVQLNQTNIAGNRRYLDVVLMDPQGFLAGHNIDVDKAARFLAMTPEQQQAVISKGTLSTARDPTAVLVRRMNEVSGGKGSYGPAKGSGGGGKGSGPYGGAGMGQGGGTAGNMAMMMEMMQMFAGGNTNTGSAMNSMMMEMMQKMMASGGSSGGGMGGSTGSGLSGSSSVLVRGFDFGTTDEQIIGHMSSVGTISNLQWVDDGAACVNFGSPAEARMAIMHLQQSKLEGQRRYVDLLLMDPQEFVAGIDGDKAARFLAMSPEQQQAVMAKGSLSSARDPTAVLVQRMKQAGGAW